MRARIADVDPKAESFLPPGKPDDSGVGVNYVDAYLRPLKGTLADGRKVTFKRRGLKITLTVGKDKGEGLLRRLEHGPDVKSMLQHALEEAAAQVGARVSEEEGAVWLELAP